MYNYLFSARLIGTEVVVKSECCSSASAKFGVDDCYLILGEDLDRVMKLLVDNNRNSKMNFKRYS